MKNNIKNLSPDVDLTYEKIPINNTLSLNAYHAHLKNSKEKCPTIVTYHGLNSNGTKEMTIEFMKYIVPLGFRVISYDMRISGPAMTKALSPQFFRDIWDDAVKVLDWTYNHEGVDSQNIIALGGSLGGALVLSVLINDPRIKNIIAFNTTYNYKAFLLYQMKKANLKTRLMYKLAAKKMPNFTEFLEVCEKVSPVSYIDITKSYDDKVFLFATKDDEVLPFEHEFPPLRKALRLPERNLKVFKHGGHGGTVIKEDIFALIEFWLK